MHLVRDISNHWKNDWQHNRSLFWLEFFGTIGSVGGSAIMAFLIKASPFLIGYSCWMFGSLCLMISAYCRKASWFFVLMLFNTIMNIVALSLLLL